MGNRLPGDGLGCGTFCPFGQRMGHFVSLKRLEMAVYGSDWRRAGGCRPARPGVSPPPPALVAAKRHGKCHACNARALAVGCFEAGADDRFPARCAGRAMGAARAPEGGALTGASGGSFRTGARRTGRGIRRQSAAGARNPIWRRCRGSASRHHPDRAVRAGHRSDAASAGTGRG